MSRGEAAMAYRTRWRPTVVGDAAQLQIGGSLRYEPIKSLYFMGKATHFARNYANFNPEDFMDRKEARKMDQFSQYAIVSATEAMADSGLMQSNPNCDRIGVIWGS